MNDFADDTEEYETVPKRVFWFCEECGHADHNKPLPPDREAFYQNLDVRLTRVGYTGYKCPSCRSMSFLPKGF